MFILGTFGLSIIIIIALVLAGVLFYSGWRALRDELVVRNFRSEPPGAGSLGLTLLGLILPILLITLFLLALAAWLLGRLLSPISPILLITVMIETCARVIHSAFMLSTVLGITW